MNRRILYALFGLLAFVLVGPYVSPLPAQPDRAPKTLRRPMDVF